MFFGGAESATITSSPSTIGEQPTRYLVTANPGGATCSADASGVCTISGLAGGVEYTFTTVAYTADPTAPTRSAASLPVTATKALDDGQLRYYVSAGNVSIVGCVGGPQACPAALTIPNSISVSGSDLPVTRISRNAFIGSTTLTTVTVPKTVTTVGDNAFNAAVNLASVFYRGDAPAAGAAIYQGSNAGLSSHHFAGTSGWPEVGSAWQARATALILSPATPPAPTATAGIDSATVVSSRSALGDESTGYLVTASLGGATCKAGASGVGTVTGLTAGAPYTFTTIATNAAGSSRASVASNAVAAFAFPAIKLTVGASALSSRISFRKAGTLAQVATRSAGRKVLTICKASVKVTGASSAALICKLSSATRKALRKTALRVSLKSTFTPVGGSLASKLQMVTLKRRR